MQLALGEIYEGKVTGITKFGAFVSFENGQTGMVHISEVALSFVNEIKDFITEGQTVKVKVLSISDEGKISLSIKKAMDPEKQREAAAARKPREFKPRENAPHRRQERPAPQPGPARPGDFEWQQKSTDSLSFEDMMSKFKQASDEKISALKRGNDSKRGYSKRR